MNDFLFEINSFSLRHCSKIFENIDPRDQISLAHCHDNIGQIHQYMTDYFKALFYHQKALELKQSVHKSHDEDLAESYGYIGLLYDQLCEYQQALLLHEETIQIRSKTLRDDCSLPDNSYKNLASVHRHMGDYFQALLNYMDRQRILCE